MSRIGKKPVIIPQGVTVEIKDNFVKAKGSLGELTLELHPKVRVVEDPSGLLVTVQNQTDKFSRSLWGLYRSLLNNMVNGVATGFAKILEVNGVGYKAAVNGKKLVLNLGFSHPIEMEIPKELEVKVEKNTITIKGADKQQVGQFAAMVRSKREPEPYKGKGIKYSDEVIRRKAGKVVKAVGGGK
ncbi:MAG: 50S ribosomal protein L6 [Candidatus Doudnabacteria bacterium]|nr:50S ribosomal protein L6 [Candidatus Doudnabacteria bacterium]